MFAKLRLTLVAVPALAIAPSLFAQNAQVPEGPFKSVHLVSLDTAQEAKLTRTIGEVNRALSKAGYPNLRYRVYKVSGEQKGPYTHIWEASWSGRAEYEKVHQLPVYKEMSALLNELG
jgi:hypothetical protein